MKNTRELININGEGKRTTMIREGMVDGRNEKRLQRKSWMAGKEKMMKKLKMKCRRK